MKEIENPLKYELIDLYYSKGIKDWKESEPEYDINNMAGISVFIHPEHAKSINEIKSFTMHFDIMGTMNIDFEREETPDAEKSPN